MRAMPAATVPRIDRSEKVGEFRKNLPGRLINLLLYA